MSSNTKERARTIRRFVATRDLSASKSVLILFDLSEDLIHQSTQAGWGLATQEFAFDTASGGDLGAIRQRNP